MNALWCSILIPFAGPLVHLAMPRQLARPETSSRAARWARVAENLGMALLALAMLFSVMPANYRAVGLYSIALTLASFGVALGASRLWQKSSTGRDLVLAVTVSGILVHALTDGAALFSFGGFGDAGSGAAALPMIAPAILIDRFAIGLLVWLLVYPRFGAVLGIFALALIGGVTLAGYQLMAYVAVIAANKTLIGSVHALLAGVILYLAVDHHKLRPLGTESL